jgi:hypothetical protein
MILGLRARDLPLRTLKPKSARKARVPHSQEKEEESK